MSHINFSSFTFCFYSSVLSFSPFSLFRSLTTVQDYGEYQLSIIEEERLSGLSPNRKILKFGTNCDLSDKHK